MQDVVTWLGFDWNMELSERFHVSYSGEEHAVYLSAKWVRCGCAFAVAGAGGGVPIRETIGR